MQLIYAGKVLKAEAAQLSTVVGPVRMLCLPHKTSVITVTAWCNSNNNNNNNRMHASYSIFWTSWQALHQHISTCPACALVGCAGAHLHPHGGEDATTQRSAASGRERALRSCQHRPCRRQPALRRSLLPATCRRRGDCQCRGPKPGGGPGRGRQRRQQQQQ